MRSTEIIRGVATQTLQDTINSTLDELTCATKRAVATTTLSLDPHDFSATPFSAGFIVDTDGEYKIILIDNVADGYFVTPYLLKGVHYPLQLAKIYATGSPTSAKVTGFTR